MNDPKTWVVNDTVLLKYKLGNANTAEYSAQEQGYYQFDTTGWELSAHKLTNLPLGQRFENYEYYSTLRVKSVTSSNNKIIFGMQNLTPVYTDEYYLKPFSAVDLTYEIESKTMIFENNINKLDYISYSLLDNTKSKNWEKLSAKSSIDRRDDLFFNYYQPVSQNQILKDKQLKNVPKNFYVKSFSGTFIDKDENNLYTLLTPEGEVKLGFLVSESGKVSIISNNEIKSPFAIYIQKNEIGPFNGS